MAAHPRKGNEQNEMVWLLNRLGLCVVKVVVWRRIVRSNYGKVRGVGWGRREGRGRGLDRQKGDHRDMDEVPQEMDEGFSRV